MEDWPARAEANDRVGRALRKVLDLQARGAEVLLVHGNAAVVNDMTRVVEQVRAHFGAIHGVVHAAGVVKPALILESDRQRIDEVFAPKVKGALILEELLGDDPLDFFVSFSSIASVAPAVGQVDYAAANAVLDTLAKRHQRSSWARVCAVSWDPWQEVGMAVDIARGQSLAVRLDRNGSSDEAKEQKLRLGDVGDLGSLEIVPLDLPAPGAGEVQIEVFAAGLNFRDVLSTLGVLSDGEAEGQTLGAECSGRVSAIGPGVEGFSVGAPVIAVGQEAFATRVNADARLVAHKPEILSFEEAAGIAITFLTATYALNHLGHLSEGERVLIHAAAGGVGLAPIQIAAAAGAEIYATAGSDEKRDYLRDIGVKHVMDSRSLDFVEAIRNQTGGAGVDVVLNSLAGEFIEAGLKTLRPFGRFLEIGKRDINDDTAIGLLPFRNNLSLHAIDLGPMIRERHPLLVRLLGELVAAFGQGRLKPPPVHTVPWQDSRRAMQRMTSAHHVGKVVLVMRTNSEPSPGELTEAEVFNQRYARSIPLQGGLDIFQELLQAAELPSHVIVSLRPLASETDDNQAHSTQDEDASRVDRTSMVAYKSPSNPAEQQIVEIWEQVLSVDSIGMDDDFLELGGDSISSMQILNRIRRALGARLAHDTLLIFRTPSLLSEAVQEQLRGGS